MPRSEDLIASVADTNLKVIADALQQTILIGMQNAVGHQNRVNTIAEQAMAQAVKGLLEVDPLEAVSVVKSLTGNDVAQQIQSLLAALASAQQSAKIGQSTPPETAKPA